MFWQDLRFGLKLMRKNPGFTAAAVAALALGIGANTAIFSIVNAVLLRPLPYPDAGRLGILWQNSPGQGWERINVSGPNFVDYKRQLTSIEDMALFEIGTGTLNGAGEPMQVPGLRMTTNTLSMLGIRPMLGRDFVPGEGFQSRVAILSYNAWTRLYGGDPDVIGKRASADGLPYTVVGITPPNLWLPVQAEVFVPWSNADLENQSRTNQRFAVFTRLKPGVTFERASAEANAAIHRIAEKYPRMNGWNATVAPLQDAILGNARPGLLILLAAVALVLLIACTNLANLLLARASARERETAIRTALGAPRSRLVRQFLTETLLIAVLGGALGVIIALWGVDLAERVTPREVRLPNSSAEVLRPPIVMDGRVLAFTALLTLLTGFAFGAAPAVAASRTGVNEILKQAGRGSTSGRHGRRARSTFVVSEVALALVLLIGAGLTLKSFWKIRQVDPGFRPSHVLAMDTELPTDSRYRTDLEMTRFFERVLAKVEALPGVRSAAINSCPPLADNDQKADFAIEGRPLPPSGQLLPAHYRSISENYFTTIGIPLVRGRFFAPSDTAERPRVAIIDQSLARLYWPAGVAGPRDPIGQRLRFGNNLFEIVGIVGAVRNTGFDQQPRPTIYVSYRQEPEAHVTLLVRHPDPTSAVSVVKSAVYAVDRQQPVFHIRTMDEAVTESESNARFTLLLLGVFAAVALALAGGGIYGLIAYAVTQRSGEIGIRMALGAGTRQVLRLVVRDGMRLALIGVACGLAGAAALTRLMRGFLFEVSPTDSATFAAVSALVILVAFAAALWPAWRAARIDPLRALRYE
jgi:putative ABC transport system permease protein